MCGIAGFFSPSPTEFESDDLLLRMNSVLSHRGPDGAGIHRDGQAGLAHSRLAVIDVEGGHQPIVSEDGLTAVVLNGEIYNFRELRDELRRHGSRFRTMGDAEVLLRLYETWGEYCVHHLRGMFAFAIWDRRERKLWLARDRVGIKPLYYFWDGTRFLFGSELKAILQHAKVARKIDERAIDDFLALGYVPSPRTVFQGVRKLRAGHMLRVTASGPVGAMYWDLDFTPRNRLGARDSAMALQTVVRESVACHLVSDVPVGTLLSGGIDSAAVLALMAEKKGAEIPAFTATFPGTRDEDREFAEQAAMWSAASWKEIAIPCPTVEVLSRLAWHYDEPFADPSAVPTFLLCEGARRGVTVCLSGDGGDENFGGYKRYRMHRNLQTLRDLVPSWLAPTLFHVGARLTPAGTWGLPSKRVRRLLADAALPPERVYWNEMTRMDAATRSAVYSRSFLRSLQGYDPFSIVEEWVRPSMEWDSTSRLQYWDFKTYLADGILTKVDRASMAHGLEVRVPLLDHALVEHAAAIPSGLKIGSGRGKRLFKESLRDLVPRGAIKRRKRGFTPPLSSWLARTKLGPVFESRVLGGDSFLSTFLDIRAVRSVWDDQRNGGRARSHLLWSLLILEIWGGSFL